MVHSKDVIFLEKSQNSFEFSGDWISLNDLFFMPCLIVKKRRKVRMQIFYGWTLFDLRVKTNCSSAVLMFFYEFFLVERFQVFH